MRDDLKEPLDADQRHARQALDALSAPPADPAFRSALKRGFVTGALDPRFAPAGDVPYPRLGKPWFRAPLARWAVAPVALAALFLAVFFLDHGPAWHVMAASGDGVVAVDGAPVPLSDRVALASALRPGARVRVPEGSTLEIATGGALAIYVTPGSEFTVPRSPGRWLRRGIGTQVSSGELRFTTGPSFQGARLTVATLEARVEVTGTTLSVICDVPGTCVCVLEGDVLVGRPRGPMEVVGAMQHRFVFKDERDAESGAIRPEEVPQLDAFRRRGQEYFGAR